LPPLKEATSVFEKILGLPAHALIVHAAVVFIPLAALAAIVYAVVAWTRRYIWWIVAALGVVAPAAAWAARLSGNNYRNYWISHGASGDFLNRINTHQSWALPTSWLATALGVVMLAVVFYAIPTPRATSSGSAVAARPQVLVWVAMVVTVALALVTLYYVYKTGDTGARATHPAI
jgi:hypothetical protein